MIKRLLPLAPLVALLMFSSQAVAAPPTDTCADMVPESDFASLVGASGVKGYTVLQGDTVSEFDVEILAVQDNIGGSMGSPVIWAKMTSSNVLDVGGVAFGMSGSPIYTSDGKLIGALALAYSDDSGVFGITPAVFMQERTDAVPASVLPPRSVQRVAGTSASAPYLKVPLYINASLNTKIGQEMKEKAANKGYALLSVPASSRENISANGFVDPVVGETLLPGDTLALDLAVGETSLGGYGTTTYVCNDAVLGFGHSSFDGNPNISGIMSRGEILYISEVPVFGNAKIGWATDPVGQVTSDVPTAIGGTLGDSVPVVDVTGDISSDYTGQSFSGTMTSMAKPNGGDQTYFATVIPVVALGNQISRVANMGNFGDGAASGNVLISGFRDGQPFQININNAWNWYDLGFDGANYSLYDPVGYIYDYASNYPAENVELSDISVGMDVHNQRRFGELISLSWKRPSDTNWKFSAVKVKRGKNFQVRLRVQPNSGGALIDRVRTYKMNARGRLSFEARDGSGMEPEDYSFESMLQYFEEAVSNRIDDNPNGASFLSGNNLVFDQVVYGSDSLALRPPKKKKK